MIKYILLMTAFFCLWSGDVLAEITCPAKPAGKVNIIWGSEPIQYDFSKSQSQMDRIDNDTVNPYDRDTKTHVGGLMQGGIAIKSQVQVATLTYPRSKQICQWLDKMDVNININPKILIASDHKKGSCRHNAILNHEMKHIFVDREIVRKYVPLIKRELEQAAIKVGIVGPKDARNAKLFQDKITDYMDGRLKIITTKMYSERSQNQQGIDSLVEYNRVSAECG